MLTGPHARNMELSDCNIMKCVQRNKVLTKPPHIIFQSKDISTLDSM